MKKIPSKEDLQGDNSFLGKVLVFHRVKEAYRCVLKTTSDDFMLLRFGKVLGRDALPDTKQMNKHFFYLLHLFLKSVATLFTSLKTTTKDDLPFISKIGSFLFFDQDSSITKLNIDVFSIESNIDQWTWLLEKWRDMLRALPLILTQAGAFSRLVRTTVGIGLMHLGKYAEIMATTNRSPMSSELMDQELFSALQKGFYFGVAYAVVDCLQDEIHNLDHVPLHRFFTVNENKTESSTPIELVDEWLYVMEQLLSGKDFDRNQLPKTPFTSMLLESFDNLLILTESNNTTREAFNELALLLRSQRLDKKQMDQSYSDEQLYLGMLLSLCYVNFLKKNIL